MALQHQRMKTLSEQKKNKRGRPQVILGIVICKLGIVVVLISYSLLLISAIVGVLVPKSPANKYISLLAYLILVTFFSYRSYKAWCKGQLANLRVTSRRAKESPPSRLVRGNRAAAESSFGIRDTAYTVPGSGPSSEGGSAASREAPSSRAET